MPPLAGTPDTVLAVYCRDRPVHPYGIYDVANLWSRSTWWVNGDAVVGLIALPGSSTPVIYAVAAAHGDRTLDLLAVLVPRLPDRFVITGPAGLTRRLARDYRAVWPAPHTKMHLARPALLPEPSPQVIELRRDDLADVERLFHLDPHAGAFFHPELLSSGDYLGIRRSTDNPPDGPCRDGGRSLVAVAGVHVVDETHGVAALGNVATDPRRRRRGLGAAVVAALCHRLRARVDVIGLNVRDDNVVARALYTRLGFVDVAAYEEADLVRR